MEWEWWQVVIGVVVAILAIRITATINVTEWLKHRDERAVRNLRSLCPHTEIEVSEGGEIKVQSTAISPMGTVDWVCQNCGMRFRGGQGQAAEVAQYWGQNPKLWMRQMKKYEKYFRKRFRS